jgi:hypothetical protein
VSDVPPPATSTIDVQTSNSNETPAKERYCMFDSSQSAVILLSSLPTLAQIVQGFGIKWSNMLKWDALGHIVAKLVDIRYGETIFIGGRLVKIPVYTHGLYQCR